MKKILGIITLAMLIALPMSVNAGFSFGDNCTELDPTTRTKTCEFLLNTTGDTSFTKFSMNLELKNLTIKSQVANSPWENLKVTDGQATGEITKHTLTVSSATPVKGTKQKIVTMVFEAKEGTTKDSECYIKYEPCADENGQFTCLNQREVTPPTETYKCKNVNGTYYDNNGKVVTETEYNAACVTNPKTGNFLPYVVVGAGIIIAISVFAITRKNNRLYKI